MKIPHIIKNGFTIVELLIVIVIIGILLSITIVSYGPVQKNARNSQTASAVTEFRDALILYRSINRTYPAPPIIPAGNNCLGKQYPENRCWASQAVDPTLTNLLETAAGGKINMPASSTAGLRGAVFYPLNGSFSIMLDSVPASFIFYAVEGNDRCPVGPVTSTIGGDLFNQSSTPPASGQTFPPDSNNTAQCWISLPNK